MPLPYLRPRPSRPRRILAAAVTAAATTNEHDRVRLNRLRLAGWVVLQYTWPQLRDDPASVVAEVRQALCS